MNASEQSVVVGYDGSPAAGKAVRWAAFEAARRDQPLTVLVATNYIKEMTDLLSVSGVQGGTLQAEGRRLAKSGADLARVAAPPVRVEPTARGMGAVAALCEAAQSASLV
ncbi:MAG: universal stress protein, partial [Ornithinimicrobium sp.]